AVLSWRVRSRPGSSISSSTRTESPTTSTCSTRSFASGRTTTTTTVRTAHWMDKRLTNGYEQERKPERHQPLEDLQLIARLPARGTMSVPDDRLRACCFTDLAGATNECRRVDNRMSTDYGRKRPGAAAADHRRGISAEHRAPLLQRCPGTTQFCLR